MPFNAISLFSPLSAQPLKSQMPIPMTMMIVIHEVGWLVFVLVLIFFGWSV